MQPSLPSMAMHSDALNFGYGGTLGFDTTAGYPGLWEARGFWSTHDRKSSITLTELRVVRILLARSFEDYVSDPQVRHILLHKDNSMVVQIINAMVSASKPMMSELRKNRSLISVLKVYLDARWIPSAVKKFADSLSRTWDPGDVRALRELVTSIQQGYQLEPDIFAWFLMGETILARAKQMQIILYEPWNDGRAHLWNPPVDFIPLVVRKIQHEKPTGILIVPYWPAQAWFERLPSIATNIEVLGEAGLLRSSVVNPPWRVALAMIGLENVGASGSVQP